MCGGKEMRGEYAERYGRTPSPFAKHFLEREESSARVEKLARMITGMRAPRKPRLLARQ